MLKICLINMPFASVSAPPLGLMQIKTLVDRQHSDAARTEILHANHHFMKFAGRAFYDLVAWKQQAFYTGVGEWLFRQVAFPDLPDNTEAYLARYGKHFLVAREYLDRILYDVRPSIGHFLDDLIDQHAVAECDIVGFTSMFAQTAASIAAARRLKRKNPKVIIALGGANCEHPMGEQIIKNVDCLDFVFSGCGLKSFPEFVQRFRDGDREGMHQIAGILSRKNRQGQGSGATPEAIASRVMGEELDINTDLDLDYEDFLVSLQKTLGQENIRPVLFFETSRGCWWGQRAHCTFCGLNGSTMAYRALEPVRAIRRINSALQYWPRVQRFDAVDNIMPRSYLKEVLPYVQAPEGAAIFYEVKADLNEQEFAILARAGVRYVQPGIEAFSTATLKLMKKGSTAFQNIQFLKNCLRYRVSPDWNLLVGFPGEKESTFRKYVADIPRLVHLPPPSGVFPVRFDRYSPYFVRAREYNLNLCPLDFYSLVYPFDSEAILQMAYYFMDQNFDADYLKHVVRWLPQLENQVAHWIRLWSAEDGPRDPQLFLSGIAEGRMTIFDSRLGSDRVYELDVPASRILELASSPVRIDEITRTVEELSPATVTDALARLTELGLLFEEDGRILSLVLPQQVALDPPDGLEKLEVAASD